LLFVVAWVWLSYVVLIVLIVVRVAVLAAWNYCRCADLNVIDLIARSVVAWSY
jgi:hypothetical protein